MPAPAHRIDGFSRTPAVVIRRLEQTLGRVGLQLGPKDQAGRHQRMIDSPQECGAWVIHDCVVARSAQTVSQIHIRNLRGTGA